MPLRRGADGRLGVSAASNQNQPPADNDKRQYHIDARGAQVGVAEQIAAAIKANNRQLPNLMADINMRTG
ncbi:MAG: hypothetical protein EON56_02870 [Alphaproteobacteria bacterium]|nr:MAG: hypothetical protein EON56_02870 [Alphaproteobacteria bacterium]